MTLKIAFVNAVPAEPDVSTIYLVKLAENRLQVVATGLTDTPITGLTPDEVEGWIATAMGGVYTKVEINTLIQDFVTGSQVDAKIATAIAGLDTVNPVQYAENIAARDLLPATITDKDFLVIVANATGDATVAAGAALYFYQQGAETPWRKLCEYESMDIVIPNKAILEKFTDVAGQLYYNGQPVGQVVVGATQW